MTDPFLHPVKACHIYFLQRDKPFIFIFSRVIKATDESLCCAPKAHLILSEDDNSTIMREDFFFFFFLVLNKHSIICELRVKTRQTDGNGLHPL